MPGSAKKPKKNPHRKGKSKKPKKNPHRKGKSKKPKKNPDRKGKSKKPIQTSGWIAEGNQPIVPSNVYIGSGQEMHKAERNVGIMLRKDNPPLPPNFVAWEDSPFYVQKHPQLGLILKIKTIEELATCGWLINKDTNSWQWTSKDLSKSFVIKNPYFYIPYSEGGKIVNKKAHKTQVFAIGGSGVNALFGKGEVLSPMAVATYAPSKSILPLFNDITGGDSIMSANAIVVIRDSKLFGVMSCLDLFNNLGKQVTLDYSLAYWLSKPMPFLMNCDNQEIIDLNLSFESLVGADKGASYLQKLQQTYIAESINLHIKLKVLSNLATKRPELVMRSKLSLYEQFNAVINASYAFAWYAHYLGLSIITSGIFNILKKITIQAESIVLSTEQNIRSIITEIFASLQPRLYQLLYMSYFLYNQTLSSERSSLQQKLNEYTKHKNNAQRSLEDAVIKLKKFNHKLGIATEHSDEANIQKLQAKTEKCKTEIKQHQAFLQQPFIELFKQYHSHEVNNVIRYFIANFESNSRDENIDLIQNLINEKVQGFIAMLEPQAQKAGAQIQLTNNTATAFARPADQSKNEAEKVDAEVGVVTNNNKAP